MVRAAVVVVVMGPLDSPRTGSYLLPIDTYGLSVTVFELLSWLQKRFRPFVRPSDPVTITNTALGATLRRAAKKLSNRVGFGLHFERKT